MTAPHSMDPDAMSAECTLDHCITCSDEAVPMRVLRIDEVRGLALCATEAGERSTIEVALVDARAGEDVLVHAGVALQTLASA